MLKFIFTFPYTLVYLQTLAKHVMNVHMNAQQMTAEPRQGEIDLPTLKKLIAFCRAYVYLVH
jgi:uncharacterized protein (DUF4213/DUF364 family)